MTSILIYREGKAGQPPSPALAPPSFELTRLLHILPSPPSLPFPWKWASTSALVSPPHLLFPLQSPCFIRSPVSSLSVGSITWAFKHEQIALSFKKSPSDHPVSLLTPFLVILLAELSTRPHSIFSHLLPDPCCSGLFPAHCTSFCWSCQWPPSVQSSLTSLDYAATSDTIHHSALLISFLPGLDPSISYSPSSAINEILLWLHQFLKTVFQGRSVNS